MGDVFNYGLLGIGTNVRLGKGGPRLKDSSGTIQARNNADDALARLQVATPTADDDAVNKSYVDRKAQINVVAQVKNDIFRNPGDTAVYTPNAGDVAVVTEVGTTWDTLNRLVRYNGSAWEYLYSGGEDDGTMMQTGDAITGGTVTFLESHVYIWESTAWVNVGPSTASSGFVLGAQASVTYDGGSGNVKTGVTGRVTRAIVNVTTAWDGTNEDGTLTIGDDTVNNRIAAADEIDLYTIGTYVIDIYHDYSSSTDVEFYLTDDTAGDSSQGAATIELQYAIA